MEKNWMDMGCSICRGQWERGERPRLVAENVYLHSRLYTCAACGSYWEELERYACTISIEEARKNYAEAFLAFDEKKKEIGR